MGTCRLLMIVRGGAEDKTKGIKYQNGEGGEIYILQIIRKRSGGSVLII